MRIPMLAAGFFFSVATQAQVQIGVQAGVSRISWSPADARPASSGASWSTSGTFNLQGGLIGQVSLLLAGKGTTLHHQSARDTGSLDIWLRYLELPATLVYQRSLGAGSRGFAGAGVYGAWGLYGAAIGAGTAHSGPYVLEKKVEFSRRNREQVLPPVVEPFDYGYTLLAGVERHGVQLLLSYTQGLKTIVRPEHFAGSYKNRVLSLSAAYWIPRNKKGRLPLTDRLQLSSATRQAVLRGAGARPAHAGGCSSASHNWE